MSDDYIDAGDRVVLTTHILEQQPQRPPLPAELVGEPGVVVENDGWGFCKVRLDNGATVSVWNGCDLEREPA